MSIFNDRIGRESKTVEVMIGLYCSHHHGLGLQDCIQCSELQNYALDRLYHCPFHEGKTSCKKCPIHCYKPGIKEDIKEVMAYSGPRMLWRHPILTIFHLLDSRREEPLTILGSDQTLDEDGPEKCAGPH